MKFQVDQIDHAEVTVPNRLAAAAWYQATLGLEILSEYRSWADDPNGPLMIGTKNGGTKIALFADRPTGSKRTVGFHLLAFRVDGDGFLEFIELLKTLELKNADDHLVTRNDAIDHRLAYSLYFCDPWGHQLELTTYDHETVRRKTQPSP